METDSGCGSGGYLAKSNFIDIIEAEHVFVSSPPSFKFTPNVLKSHVKTNFSLLKVLTKGKGWKRVGRKVGKRGAGVDALNRKITVSHLSSMILHFLSWHTFWASWWCRRNDSRHNLKDIKCLQFQTELPTLSSLMADATAPKCTENYKELHLQLQAVEKHKLLFSWFSPRWWTEWQSGEKKKICQKIFWH